VSSELWSWSAVDLANAIARREVKPSEAVGSAVERMRAVNSLVNAVVDDRGDEAIDQALAADDAAMAGHAAGALFGVPVTIKENIDVAGQPTPNGVPAFANVIAPGDSCVVSNMKKAGAIVIGRTNTPEFSMRLTTVNPLHGRTWNPWDANASAGGSSGGAGAAAAAGFGPIHHGNDIGGSLRYPAFCCGVATIKPTQGRIPSFNPSSTAERGVLSALMSTQGTIARSVADVRLGTDAMIQPDPRDPWHVPLPLAGAPLAAPIRVAVARNTHGYPIHPGIVELVDRTARLLADAGYHVVDEEPPPVIEALRGWFSTGVTEIKLTLDAGVRQYGSEDLQRVFDGFYAMGEILDLAGYRAGFSDRTRMMREWSVFLDRNPLVLSPLLMRPTYAWDADLGDGDALSDLMHSAMYCVGMNFLGLPAGVVPIDLVDDLPAGVQIVGRRYREDVVLDAMAAVEARAGRLVDRLWSRWPN
jgi:amidase